MTTTPSSNSSPNIQVKYSYDLKGIGFLEPKDALAKYYEVIEIIFRRLISLGGNITPLEVEIVNAFSVLRASVENTTHSPQKHDTKSAKNLVKGIGLDFAMGK